MKRINDSISLLLFAISLFFLYNSSLIEPPDNELFSLNGAGDIILGNEEASIKLAANGDVIVDANYGTTASSRKGLMLSMDTISFGGDEQSFTTTNNFNISGAEITFNGFGLQNIRGGVIIAGSLPAATEGSQVSTNCGVSIIAGGANSVLIQGFQAARKNDLTNTGGIITGGNPVILIENLPAARVSDITTDPRVLSTVPCVGGPILPPGIPTVLF